MKGELDVNQLLDSLEYMTLNVVNNLKSMSEEDFEQFVSDRQNIVEQLAPCHSAITEANKRRIGNILSYDPIILDRMQTLKKESGDWMEKRESIRVQQNAYQQAYAYDSMFIDHKK